MFGYVFRRSLKREVKEWWVLFRKDSNEALWCLHNIALRCINLTDGMKEQAHRAAALKLSVEKAPSPTQGHASWALCFNLHVCAEMAEIIHHFSKQLLQPNWLFQQGCNNQPWAFIHMHSAPHSSHHHQASSYVLLVGEVCEDCVEQSGLTALPVSHSHFQWKQALDSLWRCLCLRLCVKTERIMQNASMCLFVCACVFKSGWRPRNRWTECLSKRGANRLHFKETMPKPEPQAHAFLKCARNI